MPKSKYVKSNAVSSSCFVLLVPVLQIILLLRSAVLCDSHGYTSKASLAQRVLLLMTDVVLEHLA